MLRKGYLTQLNFDTTHLDDNNLMGGEHTLSTPRENCRVQAEEPAYERPVSPPRANGFNPSRRRTFRKYISFMTAS